MKAADQAALRIDGLVEPGDALTRLAERDAERETRRPGVRDGRSFHVGLAIAFLLTACAGFMPSYFLRSLSDRPSLGILLHVHGFLFTSWLVVLVVQTALVRVRKVALHRTLGFGAAGLAALMVPSGLYTAIDQARRHLAEASSLHEDPLAFLAIQAVAVWIFGALIGIAVWKRRETDVHRRLVVLATASIMAPAIARMPIIGGIPPLALLLSALFVVAAGIHDRRTRGSVHPLYVWGGIGLVLSGPVRIALGHTAAWHAVARFLVDLT